MQAYNNNEEISSTIIFQLCIRIDSSRRLLLYATDVYFITEGTIYI